MRKWWARLCCLLLALMLLVSVALPALAAEEEDEGVQEDTTKDYVILLDCSQSKIQNDPEQLILAACLSFLDMLPSHNTRVSVIAFGTEGPAHTNWGDFNVESEKDAQLVHELFPLTELPGSNERQYYKDLVKRAYDAEGFHTPYTHALAAAVSMLEDNTDPEARRNACIVLITDGVLDDREYINTEKDPSTVSKEAERLLTETSEKAGERDWPIYCVQLDYNNPFEVERRVAGERLDFITQKAGVNGLGRIRCEDAEQVHVALVQIYADFNKIEPMPEPEPKNLPLEEDFQVNPLTTQISINVFGTGITSVSLYQLDENGREVPYREEIDGNVNEDKLQVAFGAKYCSIRMVRPAEGNWRIRIAGNGNAQVLYSLIEIYDMDLKMMQSPSRETVVNKTDSVEVHAVFTYDGFDESDSAAYTAMPAELRVVNRDGRTIDVINKEKANYYADETGYHFTLEMGDYRDENFIEFQVVVQDSKFPSDIKLSEIGCVKLADMSTVLCPDVQTIRQERHVGETFELDLREIFNNPDNDPLEYILTCRNDASMNFTYTMNKDQMVIPAGLKPGEYQVSIAVKGEDVVYDQLTLTVVNDYPYLDVEKIEDIELWSDNYSFQEPKRTQTLDLNACFRDHEGMPLSYTLQLSDSGIVDVTVGDNGVLTANVIEGVEGDVIVTVTAADGITPDSVATASFEISVESGIVVFWKQNWIYFAIAGVILLAIVIAIIVVLKNKLVKGEWEITMDDCGAAEQIPNVDIAGFTTVGKKSKFKLVDLMNELALFLPGGWGLTITNYFSVPGADKLMLVGVTKRKGCTVINIPKEHDNILVNVNGMDVTKNKVSVYGGTLTFVLTKDDGTGDRMTITMTLL